MYVPISKFNLECLLKILSENGANFRQIYPVNRYFAENTHDVVIDAS